MQFIREISQKLNLSSKVVINIISEKALENANKLANPFNSKKILLASLKLLMPRKKDFIRRFLFLAIEVIISIIISKQYNTIPLAKEMMNVVITVIIALLAIVSTGYAFFQALINNKLLVTLLSVDDSQEGNLAKTNEYFAVVMTLQLLCLMINTVVCIFSIILPETWCLSNNNLVNELLSTLGITCILYLNFESIWEMRSFIYNVFQLYNLHAYSRMFEIIEKEST